MVLRESIILDAVSGDTTVFKARENEIQVAMILSNHAETRRFNLVRPCCLRLNIQRHQVAIGHREKLEHVVAGQLAVGVVHDQGGEVGRSHVSVRIWLKH